MNIFQKIGLARQLDKDATEVEQGMKTKNVTKIIAGVIAGATAVLQIPAVQVAVAHFLSAHPAVSAVVAGVSAILALLHNPKVSQ